MTAPLYGPMKALSQQVFAAFSDVPNMGPTSSPGSTGTPGSTRRRPIGEPLAQHASGGPALERAADAVF